MIIPQSDLLASSAKKSIKKSILLTKPFIIREINNKSGITMPLNKGQYQVLYFVSAITPVKTVYLSNFSRDHCSG
jgi:hypothetical protein